MLPLGLIIVYVLVSFSRFGEFLGGTWGFWGGLFGGNLVAFGASGDVLEQDNNLCWPADLTLNLFGKTLWVGLGAFGDLWEVTWRRHGASLFTR